MIGLKLFFLYKTLASILPFVRTTFSNDQSEKSSQLSKIPFVAECSVGTMSLFTSAK